jgi:Flp pilus assembly protein TadG
MNRRMGFHPLAWWRDRRGVAAVEFALVAPVLLVMLLGFADLVPGFTALIQLRNAIEAGASYCMHNGASSCTAAQVASQVANATNLAIAAGKVTLSVSYGCATATTVTMQAAATPNCSSGYAPGQYATVSASYGYVTTLGNVTIPLSGQTIIRIQ